MDEHDPEAVVFMIGTNDASVVNSQRRERRRRPRLGTGVRAKVANMMDLLVGGEKQRTVHLDRRADDRATRTATRASSSSTG